MYPIRPKLTPLFFKAHEIEELADVYFFRPAGLVFALAARSLGLSPTAVTVVSVVVGVAGGALLSDADLALIGFGLIIWYGVLDSSDGQLARMTGQTSEFGRIVDGLGGYVVYGAIYLALIASWPSASSPVALLLLVTASALSNIVHAQLYDFHRTAYADVVIKGRLPEAGAPSQDAGAGVAARLLSVYLALQRRLIGPHAIVEASLATRGAGGVVRPEDRERYRRHFYWPVRGWNLLGDNTRFYAIGVLAWAGRLDLFFVFLLIPMNVALTLLWLWQARADRRFLYRL